MEGVTEVYDVLKVIAFTSERKRMSVVVKRQSDGKVLSFMKGADSAIVERLKQEWR
jgi:phospholipid-translocating ATPase